MVTASCLYFQVLPLLSPIFTLLPATRAVFWKQNSGHLFSAGRNLRWSLGTGGTEFWLLRAEFQAPPRLAVNSAASSPWPDCPRLTRDLAALLDMPHPFPFFLSLHVLLLLHGMGLPVFSGWGTSHPCPAHPSGPPLCPLPPTTVIIRVIISESHSGRTSRISSPVWLDLLLSSSLRQLG